MSDFVEKAKITLAVSVLGVLIGLVVTVGLNWIEGIWR